MLDHARPGWVARLRFRAFYSRTLGGRRGPRSSRIPGRMDGHSGGHPVSPPQYLAKSTRMDSEFLALSGPQKPGEWEIDLPPDTFGVQRRGVLRAWALDFQRHVLYQLPDDQEFTVASEMGRPFQEPMVREKDPQPALTLKR